MRSSRRQRCKSGGWVPIGSCSDLIYRTWIFCQHVSPSGERTWPRICPRYPAVSVWTRRCNLPNWLQSAANSWVVAVNRSYQNAGLGVHLLQSGLLQLTFFWYCCRNFTARLMPVLRKLHWLSVRQRVQFKVRTFYCNHWPVLPDNETGRSADIRTHNRIGSRSGLQMVFVYGTHSGCILTINLSDL